MKNNFCAFDIDGVLNYYPNSWINFVNKKINENFKDLNILKDSLSYMQYKKLKEEYRKSGEKENLDLRDYAKEVFDILNEKYYIIIISSRPVEKYPELYNQTYKWLNKNGLKFDNVIFSEKKQYEVIKYYPNLSFMVEDNKLIANILSNLGYKVLLLNNDYNQGEIYKNVIRINNLKEVLNYAS